MLFKDSCNRKSNQQNLGTIKCSNLCTEIVEFTSPDETAVCNLASIALPRYVRERDVPAASARTKLVGSLNAANRCVPCLILCMAPVCATPSACVDSHSLPSVPSSSPCSTLPTGCAWAFWSLTPRPPLGQIRQG
jgi:hypothetical protein